VARLRTIKPGFFTNEQLAELPMAARLLFEGLWCLADREGRLEDRPKKIKVEVLPYDDENVDWLLTQLDDAGFIIRYLAEGRPYIQIVNFLKHQSPHPKEAPSQIPAPIAVEGPLLAVEENGEQVASNAGSSLTGSSGPSGSSLTSTSTGSSEAPSVLEARRRFRPRRRSIEVLDDPEFLSECQNDYPLVNVERERKAAKRWLAENPQPKVYTSFFLRWLKKAETDAISANGNKINGARAAPPPEQPLVRPDGALTKRGQLFLKMGLCNERGEPIKAAP